MRNSLPREMEWSDKDSCVAAAGKLGEQSLEGQVWAALNSLL